MTRRPIHAPQSSLKIIVSLLVAIFALIAITTTSTSGEPTTENATASQHANASILRAQETVQELRDVNLPAQYASDLLLDAEQYYASQIIIENAGGQAAYERVHSITEKIAALRIEEYRIADELDALEQHIADESGTANMISARAMYEEAKKEYRQERFTKADELIDQTYNHINEIKASNTKAKAFYDATRERTAEIVSSMWKPALITSIVLLVLAIVLRGTIRRYRLNAQLRRLHKRLVILDELLKDTQKQYFEEHTISDGEYHLRVRKYGELMRDTHRQIPLLQEQIAMATDIKEVANRKEMPRTRHKE